MMMRGMAVSLLAMGIATGAGQAKTLETIGPSAAPPPASFGVAIQVGAKGTIPSMPQASDIWAMKAQHENDTGIRTAEAAVTGTRPVYGLPTLPKGYKYAFGEGRHNPNRGERTQSGRAQMNRIWTEEVPSRLVSPQAADAGLEIKGYKVANSSNGNYRASSKSIIVPRHFNLQVATYRSTKSAQYAVGRLEARGIRARVVEVEKAGRTLSMVQAGPFANEAQTRSALSTAHAVGYTNAYMKR